MRANSPETAAQHLDVALRVSRQNLQGLELWKLAWFLKGFASIRFTESVKPLQRERERQVLIILFIVSTNQTAWGKKFFIRHTHLIYPLSWIRSY